MTATECYAVCPACEEALAGMDAEMKHIIAAHIVFNCPYKCRECNGFGVRTYIYRCPSGPNTEGPCHACDGRGWKVPDQASRYDSNSESSV